MELGRRRRGATAWATVLEESNEGRVPVIYLPGDQGAVGWDADGWSELLDRESRESMAKSERRYQRLDSLTATDGAVGEVDALERLTALHEKGALTDAEFAAEKSKLFRGS